MPYYLVPMVANAAPGPMGILGTHPLSLDFGGNAVILDATIAYGWTPDPIPDPRATWICDEKDDIVTGAARAALQQLVPGRVMGARFSDIVGNMLKIPPVAGPKTWNPLTPHQGRQQLEILLGPGNFLGPGPGNPGLLWSEPAVVGGPHSKTITDTFNRANSAVSGSTSSDGLFTWSMANGASANINIVSNQAVISRAGADTDIFVISSLSMDTADMSCSIDMSLNGTNTYSYVFLRNKNGTIFVAGEKGYAVQLDRAGDIYKLYTMPDFNVVNSLGSGGAISGLLYLDFIGSTYTLKFNGSTVFSGTDLISTGAAGERKVGFGGSPYTSDANTISVNNFFAADITPPPPTPMLGMMSIS